MIIRINRIFPVIVGVFLACTALAQSPATEPKTPGNNPARGYRSKAKAEAERIANERRAEARSLLISLATDARSFRDLTLRARSLARIADVLWAVDAEQGRALFRKAWEAAETADQDPEKTYTLGQPLPNIRREVLTMSAKRDRLLAEEFLQKLKADQQETKNETSEDNSWSLPEAQQQRLDLAESLLNTGDIDRAQQFADPVLGSATISTLTFLTHLREHRPTAADQRYAALVANSRDNIRADANTISLLSSYIFTPQRYVLFNTQGYAGSVGLPSVVSPVNVDPELRLAFFRTAASVLLRPQPPPDQDQSTTGIVGKYFAVRHLLPLFDQYGPKEIAVAMRSQLEALNSLVSNTARQGENEIQKWDSLDESLSDQEQSLLDQVEAAKTSDERDELYFKLALRALRTNDLKARDYVDKIEESELRKRARAWVDWGLAIGAIRKKNPETALELLRTGELTHIQRVWILTQSAKLLAKPDRDKALSLLDDATAAVRRIDGDDLDRPRGLLAIANALWPIEPSRAWDAIFDAVKAANSVDGFTGEDGALVLNVNSKSEIWATNEPNPDFNIEGIFGDVANADYERTVQLARGFQREGPRAIATIAIARSLLNDKRSPASRPAPKN